MKHQTHFHYLYIETGTAWALLEAGAEREEEQQYGRAMEGPGAVAGADAGHPVHR